MLRLGGHADSNCNREVSGIVQSPVDQRTLAKPERGPLPKWVLTNSAGG